MDGSLAIEANRQALKRIVAMLTDMAGFSNDAPDSPAIPRLLWRAILALLRPAESAARRLIIAASVGLAMPPATPRQPRPQTMEPLLRRLGIAVMMPPGGLSAVAQRAKADGGGAPARRLSFPLFDPPRRLASFSGRPHHVPAYAAPRIWCPGLTDPAPLPPPPSPDDYVSAAHVGRRIAVLSKALDDLPGQARRFARLMASRGTARLPIRRTRPPGGRLFRHDPNAAHPPRIREIDEILAHAHALALHALEKPDTS